MNALISSPHLLFVGRGSPHLPTFGVLWGVVPHISPHSGMWGIHNKPISHIWEMVWGWFGDVLGMFWGCSGDVWEVFGMCLEGVWKVFGMFWRWLEGVWVCLSVVWDVFWIVLASLGNVLETGLGGTVKKQ